MHKAAFSSPFRANESDVCGTAEASSAFTYHQLCANQDTDYILWCLLTSVNIYSIMRLKMNDEVYFDKNASSISSTACGTHAKIGMISVRKEALQA
jgi:hypothetical protein